jgi:hypothetical protein
MWIWSLVLWGGVAGFSEEGATAPSGGEERPASALQKQQLKLNSEEQKDILELAESLLKEMAELEEVEVQVYSWFMEDTVGAMRRSLERLEREQSDGATLEAQQESVETIERMLDGLKELVGHLAEDLDRKKPNPPKDHKDEKEIIDPLVQAIDELRLLRVEQRGLWEQADKVRKEILRDRRGESTEKSWKRVLDRQKRVGEVSGEVMEQVAKSL